MKMYFTVHLFCWKKKIDSQIAFSFHFVFLSSTNPRAKMVYFPVAQSMSIQAGPAAVWVDMDLEGQTWLQKTMLGLLGFWALRRLLMKLWKSSLYLNFLVSPYSLLYLHSPIINRKTKTEGQNKIKKTTITSYPTSLIFISILEITKELIIK